MLAPLHAPGAGDGPAADRRPGDRQAVLDATLGFLTARQYMLDEKPVDQGLSARVRDGVALCYDSAAPLPLSISLGSFKSPRLGTAPYADWSEFLHLRYMLVRASELAAVYPFGVELSYVLLDLSTVEIASISAQHSREYCASFEDLARHLVSGVGSDVVVRCMPLSRLVGQDEYEERMKESLTSVCADWQRLSPEKVSAEMDKSRRAHLHVDGADDATLERAAKTHLALLKTLPRLAYYRDPARMHILLRKNQGELQGWLSQKSYRNSIVQFWVGSGCVVIRSKGRCSATILSPNQLASRRLIGSIADFSPPVENPNLRAVPIYE
jgi:hypothetical protein